LHLRRANLRARHGQWRAAGSGANKFRAFKNLPTIRDYFFTDCAGVIERDFRRAHFPRVRRVELFSATLSRSADVSI
jgi:hypothetical protein